MFPFKVIGEGTEGDNVDLTPDADELATEDQFHHFVDCIQNGKPTTSPISQGYQMLSMLDGLYRSQETGASVDISDV